LASGDKDYFFSCLGQSPTEIAPNSTHTKNCDPHESPPLNFR
jgi:hypothetical protein